MRRFKDTKVFAALRILNLRSRTSGGRGCMCCLMGITTGNLDDFLFLYNQSLPLGIAFDTGSSPLSCRKPIT